MGNVNEVEEGGAKAVQVCYGPVRKPSFDALVDAHALTCADGVQEGDEAEADGGVQLLRQPEVQQRHAHALFAAAVDGTAAAAVDAAATGATSWNDSALGP